MDEQQKARYSRHTQLEQFGEAGQERLLAARVLVVGMGGLGSPAAMYLAASGVGHLVISDYDQVEISNLQRQIVHRTDDVGRHKVASARDTLAALNPGVRVEDLAHALDEGELAAQVSLAQVVVDASDNFETRFALNAACVATGTPLVSGAASRFEGQVSVFQPGLAESPCYRCLYSDEFGDGEPCALTGVLAPLLGIVGSIQATEVIKLLLGTGTPLTGRLVLVDALHMDIRTVRIPRDPACPVCSAP